MLTPKIQHLFNHTTLYTDMNWLLILAIVPTVLLNTITNMNK